MTEEQINRAVARFLSWKLPADFHPDAGISFQPSKPHECVEHDNSRWPVGTNLFTADQAREMIVHMIGHDSKAPL